VLPCRRGAGLRIAGIHERIEMPPHARGGNSQLIADLCRGDGPGFQEQLHDCAARVALTAIRDEFHNTIVTEFQNPV
jgi:hypothetical protein